jgi:hypothetical protein
VPELRWHAQNALPELRRLRDRPPGARADQHLLRQATVEQPLIDSADGPRPSVKADFRTSSGLRLRQAMVEQVLISSPGDPARRSSPTLVLD